MAGIMKGIRAVPGRPAQQWYVTIRDRDFFKGLPLSAAVLFVIWYNGIIITQIGYAPSSITQKREYMKGDAMERFDALIKKDGSGRLTIVEVPFDAKTVFSKPKGTIYVSGTINGIGYRSKLLSRGSGRFVMVLDKAVQKSIGFDGQEMTAQITMSCEDLSAARENLEKQVDVKCDMDVLTAIKTRQSIREFTSGPVSQDMVNAILLAGMQAPTAKNKRPYHFIVIRDRHVLSILARHNPNAAMMEESAGAIIVCGDKNMEGIKEFLYADCAAATQNMLLSMHGLGLGGVWCGVAPNSDWRKLLIHQLALPPKLEPISVIVFGWPAGTRESSCRWEPAKVHYEKW